MSEEKILIIGVDGNLIEVPIEEVNQKNNEPTVAEYINENNIVRWREKEDNNE